jgi:polyisoprenoid-binding protein YceI
VTKPEKLTLTLSREGAGTGTLVGVMAFDRKEYGMNSGIPFIKSKRHFEAVSTECI